MCKENLLYNIASNGECKRKHITNKKVDPYRHFSAVVSTSGRKIYAEGYNHKRGIYSPSIHAEAHCMQKLLNRNIKGRVNIVVIRTDFNNSKPCSNCIGLMNKCKENGLNIHNIYYSNEGYLVKKTLVSLTNEKQHISKGFRMLGFGEDEEDNENLEEDLVYFDIKGIG